MNGRIQSIDILRAITMTLMIFVNDLWSLKNIPLWLEHTAAATDGMGLADTVFPAFLVIVGMSIPHAITSRQKKGENNGQILHHILQRAFALIVMGVFLVNGETINEAASMPRYAWNMLACLAFIILWNTYPKRQLLLKSLAWILLITLAFLYRGGPNGTVFFNHSWWGILGLIGWAYLPTAAICLYSKNNPTTIAAFSILCLLTCVASHAGLFTFSPNLRQLLAPFGEGAMPAFTSTGVLASLIHARSSKKLLSIFLLAAFCLITGFLFRPLWGISKIRATPSWVLICSAITLTTFIITYWLTDIHKRSNWFRIISPAGTNTLLCYLLPYFAYGFLSMFALNYPEAISNGTTGLLKSFLFALIIVNIAGLLGRIGLRLKL